MRSEAIPVCDREQTVGSGQVHVWILRVDCPLTAAGSVSHLLSPDERARAARFHFDRDMISFTVTRACLRTLLAHQRQCDPAGIRFRSSSEELRTTTGIWRRLSLGRMRSRTSRPGFFGRFKSNGFRGPRNSSVRFPRGQDACRGRYFPARRRLPPGRHSGLNRCDRGAPPSR